MTRQIHVEATEVMENGKKLTGKKALVTGAARGIGRGCALALAREGAAVALNDLPGAARDLREAAALVESEGVRAVLTPGDVSDLAWMQSLGSVIEELGQLDILVSTVAYEVHKGLLDLSLDEMRRTLEVTLLSAFSLAQIAARHMVDRGGGGKIIFISSIHAETPFRGAIAYNTAKAGLDHFARSAAAELAGCNINVNVIAPGWIDTPGERRWHSEEKILKKGRKLPWGRLGTADEIGKAAAFLASADADYISGAILKVDGALTASLAVPDK